MAWHNLSNSLKEGGLGVKSLKSLNKAALLKLTFDMLASIKEWAIFYRNRFYHMHKPATSFIKSSVWPEIKAHLHIVCENSAWQNSELLT